jgi:hypothetical protein
MSRYLLQAAVGAVFLAAGSSPLIVLAVAPNPLENVYWRFEEGPHNSSVNAAIADPVQDSINQNHLDAFSAAAAPTYTNLAAPTDLKSGLTNNFALDFIRSPGANDDLFTLFEDGDHGKGLAKNINNGIIAPGQGFTVEAAFNTTNVGDFQAIIAKEGQPGLGKGLGFIENLPTFAIKARRLDGNPEDFRDGRVQVEMWDGAGNLIDVVSDEPISTDQWYYVAVVNDGANLSMYLDSNDGNGYVLQGTPVPVAGGALYQGEDPENPSWDNSWVVGRAQFGGNPGDFFDGRIDEVRITNSALSPSQFLFAPPGGLEGDFNDDGTVDAADYVVWRKTDGTAGGYSAFRANFGLSGGAGGGGGSANSVVPEPASLLLCFGAFATLLMYRRADR